MECNLPEPRLMVCRECRTARVGVLALWKAEPRQVMAIPEPLEIREYSGITPAKHRIRVWRCPQGHMIREENCGAV